MKVRKNILKRAHQYAMLSPEFGYPDMNAAIAFAKELIRLAAPPKRRRLSSTGKRAR